jgi:hypothetical protein
MTIRKPQLLPQPQDAWFDPKTGKPTTYFYQYLREADQALRELIDAANDHETRITALEP